MKRSTRMCTLLVTFVALSLVFSAAAFAGPAITSITPNTAGGDWVTIEVEIIGTGFEEGATVLLTRGEGHPELPVFGTVESSTKITGGFSVRNIAPGACDVVVENPDGQSATLTGGFTFTE